MISTKISEPTFGFVRFQSYIMMRPVLLFNKVADQTVHVPNLIKTILICHFDGIINFYATSKFPRF